MKKIITSLFALTLSTGIITAWVYTGPWDERAVPGFDGQIFYTHTMGWQAQYHDFSGVADVIEDEPVAPDFPHGYFKVRIVNAIYGCTNGQELVIEKDNPQWIADSPNYDPGFEYYPTNHSRIVFAALTHDPESSLVRWNANEWNQPPPPEIIMTPTNRPGMLWYFTRAWWYDGYQDNLPYAHFTNLVHVTRVERNWTNFYYIVRDAVPNPSDRVWGDSFDDLTMLYRYVTPQQFKFMYNDPLLNNEIKLNMKEWNDGNTTPFPY